ncbi:sequestosome-1-like [Diadema antillarum]|uniref:sequestosome-1-like n=1 Tax=Diadema antillarum TaxID=105358 RepID=UPI003A892DBC
MAMTVKAYLKRGENANAEIRRFVVDESVTSSFEYLSKKVSQVFPSLGSPENFTIAWKDTEGDLITFSSDDELMEALGQLNEDIFRIYVKENRKGRRDRECPGKSSTDGPPPKQGTEEEVFHPGVICDGCNNRIRGPRFKCVTCPDYDLCKFCEGQGIHPEHSFVKFRKPQVGRSHHGGFFHHPGMFRPYGHRGWRHWWAWNQQQQQQNQSQEGEQGGAGPSAHQGPGAPGPHGDGPAGPMGPGPFGPPPHPHMPPPPPPHEFLRDIGQSVAQMLDPLGIDVDIDIDHNGQRTHCGGRGKHGRRHGKGRRGCRYTWAGTSQEEEEERAAPSAPTEGEGQKKPDEGSGSQEKQQGNTPSQGSKGTAEPMEMGENGTGAGGSSGSDDADWTMLEDGTGTKSTPPPDQVKVQDDSTEYAFMYETALRQMQAMGFDNDGGWLQSLLEAKGGDIGRVLDAIKVGNQPTYPSNAK